MLTSIDLSDGNYGDDAVQVLVDMLKVLIFEVFVLSVCDR